MMNNDLFLVFDWIYTRNNNIICWHEAIEFITSPLTDLDATFASYAKYTIIEILKEY